MRGEDYKKIKPVSRKKEIVIWYGKEQKERQKEIKKEKNKTV